MAYKPNFKPGWFLEGNKGPLDPVTVIDKNWAGKNWSGTPAQKQPQKQPASPPRPAAASPTYNPYADFQAQLQAQYEAQQRAAEEAMRRKQEAAQAAYDRNMGALNNTYNTQLNGLKGNYDSSMGVLQGNYEQGVAGVNKQADGANQQAYINYMMSKRDLPQQLTAQGISGGAAESTMAGLYNNYGNSRNTIDAGRNDSLADLALQLDNNKASAKQNYNNQRSQLEAQKAAQQMQLENNLANMIADAETANYDQQFALSQDYINKMAAIQQEAAKASQKAAARAYSASNKGPAVDTKQSGMKLDKTAAYQRALANYKAGSTVDEVIQDLGASGMDAASIQQILAAMGF